MKSLMMGMLLLSALSVPASSQLYNPPSPRPPSPPTFGTGPNPNNHYVPSYTTNRGTTVPEHYQTNPNGTRSDNYGTSPNINPYTGGVGTRRF